MPRRRWEPAEVFVELGAAVLGYLRAAGPVDREDLLSDVFVRVTQSLPRFEGDEEELRRWVFTIARNRLLDEYRRRARRARPQIPDASSSVVPAPDEPLDQQLLAALRALTHEQREVVVLRFVGDLSLEQVAAMTKRSEGAVKSLQHHALAALAMQLEASR